MRSAYTHRASGCQWLLARLSQAASRRWVATSIKRWKTLHHFSLFTSPLLLIPLFLSPSCCCLSRELSQKSPECASLRVHTNVNRFALSSFSVSFLCIPLLCLQLPLSFVSFWQSRMMYAAKWTENWSNRISAANGCHWQQGPHQHPCSSLVTSSPYHGTKKATINYDYLVCYSNANIWYLNEGF